MNWRKIEQALIEIAKAEEIDIIDASGNSIVNCQTLDGGITELSITDLAKELAERLA